MDDVIWPVVVAIATIATTATTVSNWLNQRFKRQEVIDAKHDDALEHHLYLINANRELVEHRTSRFVAEMGKTELSLTQDIDATKGAIAVLKSEANHKTERLEHRLRDVENFLAKNNNFHIKSHWGN